MVDYIRYYEDDTGAVEFTNYVDLKVISCTHKIDRDLAVLPGNAGSNTYRDDQRYSQMWTIVARCDRQVTDTLRGWADNTFDANTTLRVYNKYAADYYNDYTGVKMKSFQDYTDNGGQSYSVTLVVVK